MESLFRCCLTRLAAACSVVDKSWILWSYQRFRRSSQQITQNEQATIIGRSRSNAREVVMLADVCNYFLACGQYIVEPAPRLSPDKQIILSRAKDCEHTNNVATFPIIALYKQR
ncbi:hypothetical protein AB1N83_003396 [Pleurotus pulmonarius]